MLPAACPSMPCHAPGDSCDRANSAHSCAGSKSLWHLDIPILARIGHEAHALVERQRAWMVQSAGVDQQRRDRSGPGIGHGVIEEEISESFAHEFRYQSEIGDLAGRGFAEIEFGHPR